ncbi:hypothetical protein F4806DRAFT_496203 [Annulohypoxylon nitens]|nr:hypothetical protein F4806DRAFT_496203 [Annulohypoxylon nitens]
MSNPLAVSSRWRFTRPDSSNQQFLQDDLRQVAGQQEKFNLPWQDNMYLVYPSPETPDWPAFVADVERLNMEADANTQYKIIYIMRRAHKEKHDIDVHDPQLDDEGRTQCTQLVNDFGRAIHSAGLPRPQVILTSPLARALETTKFGIAPLFPAVRPIIHECLRERMNGTERNKRHDKRWIEQHFPELDIGLVDEIDHYGAVYGNAYHEEPYEARWQRIQGVLSHVFDKYEDSLVVLLMTHCCMQQTIQREITGWDVPEKERKGAVELFIGEAKGYAIIVKGVRI